MPTVIHHIKVAGRTLISSRFISGLAIGAFALGIDSLYPSRCTPHQPIWLPVTVWHLSLLPASVAQASENTSYLSVTVREHLSRRSLPLPASFFTLKYSGQEKHAL